MMRVVGSPDAMTQSGNSRSRTAIDLSRAAGRPAAQGSSPSTDRRRLFLRLQRMKPAVRYAAGNHPPSYHSLGPRPSHRPVLPHPPRHVRPAAPAQNDPSRQRVMAAHPPAAPGAPAAGVPAAAQHSSPRTSILRVEDAMVMEEIRSQQGKRGREDEATTNVEEPQSDGASSSRSAAASPATAASQSQPCPPDGPPFGAQTAREHAGGPPSVYVDPFQPVSMPPARTPDASPRRANMRNMLPQLQLPFAGRRIQNGPAPFLFGSRQGQGQGREARGFLWSRAPQRPVPAGFHSPERPCVPAIVESLPASPVRPMGVPTTHDGDEFVPSPPPPSRPPCPPMVPPLVFPHTQTPTQELNHHLPPAPRPPLPPPALVGSSASLPPRPAPVPFPVGPAAAAAAAAAAASESVEERPTHSRQSSSDKTVIHHMHRDPSRGSGIASASPSLLPTEWLNSLRAAGEAEAQHQLHKDVIALPPPFLPGAVATPPSESATGDTSVGASEAPAVAVAAVAAAAAAANSSPSLVETPEDTLCATDTAPVSSRVGGATDRGEGGMDGEEAGCRTPPVAALGARVARLEGLSGSPSRSEGGALTARARVGGDSASSGAASGAVVADSDLEDIPLNDDSSERGGGRLRLNSCDSPVVSSSPTHRCSGPLADLVWKPLQNLVGPNTPCPAAPRSARAGSAPKPGMVVVKGRGGGGGQRYTNYGPLSKETHEAFISRDIKYLHKLLCEQKQTIGRLRQHRDRYKEELDETVKSKQLLYSDMIEKAKSTHLVAVHEQEEFKQRAEAHQRLSKDLYRQVSELEARNEDLTNMLQEKLQQGLCVVCMERQSNAILFPCRHVNLCQDCCVRLHTCPVCRSHIAHRFQVFFA
ncbi:unnamed protein product [Vitrella brassicaformis CCMP3155]|uniref:RING-type domain-containing protein n=2 Tax=Vitrella brassicaformis TaxID=1169539 RepID=A0A0G4FDN8_VITBC|nr:unnamed protein product [Vitrella brassicaformis CCMP3155]|eukprot:CEM11310.1 unnamed protein product [Vitrella brassicaformis CCMP3155]